jgi:hypothetical protein
MNKKELELLKQCDGKHKTASELFECDSCCLMFEIEKDIIITEKQKRELIIKAYKRGAGAGAIVTAILLVAIYLIIK